MTKPIIPEAALAQHIAVLGKTRSGKSSVMRGLVEGLLEREQPVCIVDPKGDWWGIKLARDGKRPGYPVVIFGGEHADVPINVHAGAHVAELFATGNRPCLIDLGGWMVGDRTRFWIDFASSLFKHTKGMRWLVVDEAHNFAPKGKIMDPDAGRALHWANRLASEGLGKGVHMIFASQRPQKVHNDTLTSAETLIAMRVLHPSDRGAVSDWIKGCGDLELGNKVLNSLADMKRGEGWAWSPEIDFGPERVQFPMFKTYDSFRPQSAEETQALKGWASVDLDEVKAKLVTVVKEAEANDPKLLRAEIAKLKAELAKKPVGDTGPTPAWRAEYEAAHARDTAAAHARGVQEGRADAFRAVQPLAERLGTLAGAVGDTIEGFRADLTRLTRQSTAAPAPRPRSATPAPVSYAKRKTPVIHGDALPKVERQLLTVLAQRHPKPSSKSQLAVLSGYSITSSSFANGLGALRSKGYANGYGDANRVTDAGLAALGSYEPLPTGQALITWWLGRLSKAERTFLEYIAGRYPSEVTKEELAGETGYSITSSSFANALGKLRTLELIQRGEIKASEELFG